MDLGQTWPKQHSRFAIWDNTRDWTCHILHEDESHYDLLVASPADIQESLMCEEGPELVTEDVLSEDQEHEVSISVMMTTSSSSLHARGHST